MTIEICPERHRSLTEYAGVSVAYHVRAVVGPLTPGAPVVPLPRVPVAVSRKDYDAIPGNHPRDWPVRFATDRARFLGAYNAGQRVGAAVVILERTDVMRLGGEPGLALLWDLRVAPEARGRGVGRTLLGAAEVSTWDAGASGMMIETQTNNVAACELYARAGYRITKVAPTAYPDVPGDVQVMWAKTFGPSFHPADER
jgi:ribosomal protein S18 acetylase RimI-like enzyme